MLLGRCWEAGGAPAYWPWLQALRGYVRASDTASLRADLGGGAADIAHVLPELRERLPGIEASVPVEPEGARFRLFDATAQFLRKASERRPMVLVLDDLHAADAPSLLLLQFLARELGASRILIVAACRDVDPVPAPALTGTLAQLPREPVTRRLELGGLSEPELAEYVARETTAPVAVPALHEQTGGNPLFAGEIARLLSVDGGFGVPQSVRDVIARRLTHLSDACKRALVLASVMGREFSLDALARLDGVSEDAVLDLLDEAIAARVVSDVPAAPGRARFAHVLIRDTLYEGLSAARRMRLHRRTVDELEALYGDEPGPHLAELAHHAIAARDRERAVRYATLAADRALGPLLLLARVAEAEAGIAEGARLAEQLRQPAHLWDVRGGEAMLAIAVGRLDDAERLVEDARALGERAQPDMAMPLYHAQRCTLSDFRGRLEEVEAEICALAADRPARPVFRCLLAHLHARIGRRSEAARALAELTARDCAALPFDQEWLLGMSYLAETAGLLGDAEAAEQLSGRLEPWAQLNVVDQCEAMRGAASRYLGILATTTGGLDDAASHFEHALELNARMGARPWLARTREDYARMLGARGRAGDRERARERGERATATYRELGMASGAALAAAH